jgi:hypothetical protein
MELEKNTIPNGGTYKNNIPYSGGVHYYYQESKTKTAPEQRPARITFSIPEECIITIRKAKRKELRRSELLVV